jgi:hypothetical protein
MSTGKQLPVIRKALGNQWQHLGKVVRQHYDISPGTDSDMLIEGIMGEVYHSAIAKLFLIPGRLFGALVPYRGKQIPTQVRNWTLSDNDKAMFWHRTLQFPAHSPIIFRSRMEHVRGNEIIEFVRFGMGIRMLLSVRDAALVYESVGYVWKIGGVSLPIPGWAILGNAVIIERPLSDKEFDIDFIIRHPLFGRTFAYSGRFSITVSDSGSEPSPDGIVSASQQRE